MSKNEIAIQHSPTPATLLEQAINKGVDITQLEKLMDLQERWEQKEAKKKFLDALSRFQTMVPALGKKKTAKVQMKAGGTFSYKYADLGSITAQIKKPLNECGLSYRWEFSETNGKLKVTCMISHRDGHTESTSMEAGMDNSGAKNDIQQKGSTQTYLQRYTLIGALGLSTADEDTDGKGHHTTVQETKEMTEEEVFDQWRELIREKKTVIELQALYMQNKKVVESDARIKQLFTDRKEFLNQAGQKNGAKPVMP